MMTRYCKIDVEMFAFCVLVFFSTFTSANLQSSVVLHCSICVFVEVGAASWVGEGKLQSNCISILTEP